MQSLIRAMRIRNGSLRRGDGGQSLVEFGLVAPVLLLVLTGIFSFGIILTQYEVLTDAVSAGARAFALSRLQTTPALAVSDPCAYAISILEGAAPNLTSSSMNFTIVYTDNSGTTPSVSNYTTSCTDRASTGSSKMHSDDQVQITATYPVTPLVFRWTTSQLTMSSSATELVN
jgi:Flp pilus assembly protein TadG